MLSMLDVAMYGVLLPQVGGITTGTWTYSLTFRGQEVPECTLPTVARSLELDMTVPNIKASWHDSFALLSARHPSPRPRQLVARGPRPRLPQQSLLPVSGCARP